MIFPLFKGTVMPAQARTHLLTVPHRKTVSWTLVFAGVTMLVDGAQA